MERIVLNEFFFSIVMAICSFALVVVTIAYAIATGRMRRESKKQRLLKSEPKIIAYLKSTEDHNSIRLYIKNVGYGVAKNVKVCVLKDYCMFGVENKKLSGIGMLKHGLVILPSQEEYSCYIDAWKRIGCGKDIESLYIELAISYEGIFTDGKKSKTETFKLPLIQISGQDYSTPPETYIGKIAHHLGQISNLLQDSPLMVGEKAFDADDEENNRSQNHT